MDQQKTYTLEDIVGMLSNLDNRTADPQTEMPRVRLPIPKEYGGGSVTADTMEKAVRRLLEKVGTPRPQRSEAPTFEALWEKWLAIKSGQEKSPSTIESYKGVAKTHLLPYFGKKRMDEITPDDIQLFFNSIIHLSGSVSTQCKAILSGMFDQACRNDYIAKNPMQYKYVRSRKVGEKVVLQDQDLFDVISHLEDLKYPDHRDYLYACFLCFTALRRSEILGLRWGDLDFESHEISVRNAVSYPYGDNNPYVAAPKDGSVGVVLLQSGLASRIRPYAASPAEYIIANADDPLKPITRSSFTKMWNRIRRNINLHGATSHSFRATYATMMNAHCDHVDAKTLQSALRHKTPDLALKVYTKKNISKTRKVEQEYDAYLSDHLSVHENQPQALEI